MKDIQSLCHSKWEGKYHVVWIPKCRKKTLYQQWRQHLGDVFHELARQKECQILEGHRRTDHVHRLLSVPPRYAVAQVKGKSAIHSARIYGGRRKNATGQPFWARGYYVSTTGRDEAAIRRYIEQQEKEDRRLDQVALFDE